MPYQLIYDVPGAPTVYLCSDDDITGTDEEINAALPNVPVGTMITTAGYATMKQLGPDGWAAVGGNEGGGS